jgi:hypothetical protein
MEQRKITMRAPFFPVIFLAGCAPKAIPVASPPHPVAQHQESTRQLPDRFNRLSCAIVSISNSLGSGTGFVINAQGDIMTAAHVVFSRTYSIQADRSIGLALSMPVQQITANDGTPIHVTTGALTQVDIGLASYDLAVLHTDRRGACSLAPNLDHSPVVGEHILSIGHPALSGSAVLFEGFVSSIHLT